MLEKEFEFYIKNQKELLKKYKDQYVVIKDEAVIGAYPTENEAYVETIRLHKPGAFLIQKCVPGEESYSQTYHTKAIFNT